LHYFLITSCNAEEATTKKKLKELGFLTQYEKQQKEVAAREAEKKRANGMSSAEKYFRVIKVVEITSHCQSQSSFVKPVLL